MPVSRRQFSNLAAGCLLAAVPAAWVHAKDSALPVPASLPQTAAAAKARRQPLVLLITLSGSSGIK